MLLDTRREKLYSAHLHPSTALINNCRTQAGSGRQLVPAWGEELLSARTQTASPRRQSELCGTPQPQHGQPALCDDTRANIGSSGPPLGGDAPF